MSHSRSTSQRLVPDFQTLHAAQEALRASRSEEARTHITVPHEFHLSLAERAKEREQYEAERRERELEAERAAEEARREREEQEEREWREARRRAIPKAHEVPEWYDERPKLKKDSHD